ncbi:cyclic nucleotide-binding protein [Methylobacillus sp. MM3]|uniref:YhjD/YihY/BrkB family envelope integrity protein n=1 Tax=Methylobacillus sp. MM3 TaxID=1848039 RepID=UPI0007E25F43|nr:YhjD/YihY/BrkB family envelope integrity protein [Methylobacillus sp. MM3]OAJ70086.1 cyclic nucleotide-binding protein [Methylobacillus sp. MM3]
MSQPIKKVVNRTRETLLRQRYKTSPFIISETLTAFQRHHGFSISASLAFYALFALIPMALLMFFLLSHLVISSNYAIVQLAILTGNLVPEFSQRIMVEVYNISRHKAVWGAFGLFALFWAVTPLAGALRASFQTISSIAEAPSFIRRAATDSVSVIGILILLFLFTFSGIMLEKLVTFLRPEFVSARLTNTLSSIVLSTLMLATFYRIFFPIKVQLRHILIGSLLTAALWVAMRPAFELFLFFKQSYGTIFGGMKNMFIAIGWLYYSFAAFLLGTELIATLRKKDVLLLKDLFSASSHKTAYMDKLMQHFGKDYRQGQYVFHEGDKGHEMYYLRSGMVDILLNGEMVRRLSPGEYFGEMALLTNATRSMDAIVSTDHAEVLRISSENIETLLIEEPRIAMSFLREMALRLRQANTSITPSQ